MRDDSRDGDPRYFGAQRADVLHPAYARQPDVEGGTWEWLAWCMHGVTEVDACERSPLAESIDMNAVKTTPVCRRFEVVFSLLRGQLGIGTVVAQRFEDGALAVTPRHKVIVLEVWVG